jgi:glycosyl transferase family 2
LTAPQLVCLLAARDCEEDLPGWLASAAALVDVVVALDDGSSDGTAELLAAEPLVQVLLRNPRREGFSGWDDSSNRNRLLAAAAALMPRWILSLDADERIPADDAAALRRFLDEGAVPGSAYGFSVLRMIDDLDHYDRLELVTYRLFSWEAGQVFPADRLHFAPVPTSIGRARWYMTTLRIQHLAGLTEQRRQARWEKYLESDPRRRWQVDYTYTLVPPGVVKPWPARPADLPVLATPGGPVADWEVALLELDGPVLSVVVLVGPDDESDAAELVRVVVAEDAGVPSEVLLVDSGGRGAGDRVAELFPSVQVMTLDRRISRAEARDLALHTAGGDYVVVLTPGDRVAPGGLAKLAEAHESGHELVGGTVLNASDSAVGWASYFLDHAASLPSGNEGMLTVAPVCSSLPRDATLALPLGHPDRGSLPSASEQLFARGFSAARAGGLTFVHRCADQSWLGLLGDRFRKGRALERELQRRGSRSARAGLVGVSERLNLIRTGAGRADGAVRSAYGRVAPFVVAGLACTWAGASYERWLDRIVAPRRVRH